MARFIYGSTYEHKEQLKTLGARYDADLKAWYFKEPTTKKEAADLGAKIEAARSLGLMIGEKDNTIQRAHARSIASARMDTRTW